MATLTRSHVAYQGTDIGFRACCQAVHDGLGTAGWVQTADTGQINTATVNAPFAHTYAGYEMWRMADALQATAPVFLKIRYGINNPGDAALAVQVGTATDGAGNLTGISTSPVHSLYSFHDDTNLPLTATSYFSGNTSRFTAGILVPSGYNGTIVLGVERSKDASGNNTSSGVMLVSAVDLNVELQTYIPFGNVPCHSTRMVYALPSASAVDYGTDTCMSLIYPVAGSVQNPGMSIVAQKSGIAAGNSGLVNVYGTQRSYRNVRCVLPSSGAEPVQLCILFE